MPDDTPRWYWLPARRKTWQEAKDQEKAERSRRQIADREDAIARFRARTSFETRPRSSDPSGDAFVMSTAPYLSTPSGYCAPAPANDSGPACSPSSDSGSFSSSSGDSGGGSDGGSSGC